MLRSHKSFNSLFEMLFPSFYGFQIKHLYSLSILYLRCLQPGPMLDRFAFDKSFQFSIWDAIMGISPTALLAGVAAFNSLFEMPHVHRHVESRHYLTFNSLFEMRRLLNDHQVVPVYPELSILYLRCLRAYAQLYKMSAPMPFQFSIWDAGGSCVRFLWVF